MKEAITGHPRPSILRGNQSSAPEIVPLEDVQLLKRGDALWVGMAARGSCSEARRGHRRSSVALKRNHTQSHAIIRNQTQSDAIRRNHLRVGRQLVDRVVLTVSDADGLDPFAVVRAEVLRCQQESILRRTGQDLGSDGPVVVGRRTTLRHGREGACEVWVAEDLPGARRASLRRARVHYLMREAIRTQSEADERGHPNAIRS